MFDESLNELSTYRMPSRYPPGPLASAQSGSSRLVTRLGSESTSITATIRRLAYSGRDRISSITST